MLADSSQLSAAIVNLAVNARDAMRGAVRIDSEEGRGTSVRLYLPRAEGVALRVAEPSSITAAPLGRHETILVVEDDALVRGYVIAQLGGLGYRTLVASDGCGRARGGRPGCRIRSLVYRGDHARRNERPPIGGGRGCAPFGNEGALHVRLH